MSCNHLLQVNGQTSDCYNAFECQQTIIETNSLVLRCYGYRSCDLSKIAATSSDTFISCSAAYACFNAAIISNRTISCSALWSCGYSILKSQFGWVSCGGAKSCINLLYI